MLPSSKKPATKPASGKFSLIQHIQISSLIKAMLATSSLVFLIFAIQALTASARSVAENSQEGQTYNQLVSNQRHQNGKQHANGGQPTSQNRCLSGWMWFNNKCWVTTQSRRDFQHAAELCKNQYNSTLPTIHSEEENEFLRQNIELQNSPIWLYARHNHQYNRTRWLDKTPVNYTRWDVGQPSDKSSLICIETEHGWYMKKAEPVGGQTECVSFWEDAKWGTQVGCLVLLPVVCEKKLAPISRLTDGPNGSMSYEPPMAISGARSFIFNPQPFIMATIVAICAVMLNDLIVFSDDQYSSKEKNRISPILA